MHVIKDNVIKDKLKILHIVQCSYMYKFNGIPLNVGETVILSYIVIDKHCSKPRNCNQIVIRRVLPLYSFIIFIRHIKFQSSNE